MTTNNGSPQLVQFNGVIPDGGVVPVLNSLQSQINAIGNSSNGVSRYCFACIPCTQTNSEFRDLSGRCNGLQVDIANNAAFGTAGFASSIAGTAAGCSIPAAQFYNVDFLPNGFNFSKNSFIAQIQVNQAAPGSNQTIFSFGASQANTNYNGFYLSLRTSGKIELIQCVNDALYGVTATNEIVVANSTLMTYTLWYDGPTGSAWAFVNQQLSGDWPAAFTTAAGHAFGTNATVYNASNGTSVGLRVGGNCASTDTTVAVSLSNIQLYLFPDNLPVNVGYVNEKLLLNPSTPLNSNDFVFPVSKTIYFLGPGQSNEAGVGAGASGAIYRCINDTNGCPINDPVWPSSVAAGSGLAKVSAEAGRVGKWVQWKNYSIGSTALTDFWVGSVTAYTSGMVVSTGAYVVSASNGNLYQANGAAGTAYTITTDPASGVGSSGLTAWILQSNVQSFEVPGYIYSKNDGTGRFDPNGKISLMVTAMKATVGYQNVCMYVQIGQGDLTVGATLNMYKLAMINLSNYITSLGFPIVLGMTFSNAAQSSGFTSTLIPARIAALQALSNNPLVFPGADLASLMGVLGFNEANVQPYAMTPVPGYIQNTGPQYIHVNAAAFSVAAPLIAASLPF